MSHGFFSLEGGHLLSGSTIKEEGGEERQKQFYQKDLYAIFLDFSQTSCTNYSSRPEFSRSCPDPDLAFSLFYENRLGLRFLGGAILPCYQSLPNWTAASGFHYPKVSETEFLGRHSGLELGLRETSRKGQLPCKTVNTQSSPSHSGTAVSNC